MLVPRAVHPTIVKLAEGFPIIALTGPRQSGKTTLVRAVFADRPYVSLEDLDAQSLAENDPRGFLGQYPDGVVIDEAQRCPGLFSYLQTRVDATQRMGRFILTGSQQFGLLSSLTQTLAGRVALVPLLPFSLAELQCVDRAPERLRTLFFQGLYPPIHDRNLDPLLWYGNYVKTYAERDVRQLIQVRDLRTFQRFIRLCAGRTGQLLNLSSLAGDCGISHNTAKAWLSVLEASYLIHLLPPHHRNFNKRLVKTPKLYFLDVGLASWLLGIEDPSQLETHPLRGALFETWAVTELLKARFNHGLTSNLYFWRDRGGAEIDVVAERGTLQVPIELKSGETVAGDAFKPLHRWRALAGDEAGPAWLVYGGDARYRRSEVEVVPWTAIHELADRIVPQRIRS